MRALEPAELDLAAALMERAYGGPGFLGRLRLQHALEPLGCLGVWEDGVLRATACFIVYDRLAVVGLVATDPAAQGRGLARAGMNEVLHQLERRGVSSIVLDASSAGKPLYDRLGFLERGTAYTYRFAGECERAGEQVTRPATPQDLPWMTALDREATGGDRSRLLHALLTLEGGRVLALGREGFAVVRGAQIGPLIARGMDTARALLEAALALELPSVPVLSVPAGNGQVCGLLESLGLQRQRTFTHMVRGSARANRPDLAWAMCSFALG